MTLAVHDDDSPMPRVDDCWKRIGTLGDGSCPRLEEYVRCLNCPVLGRAAAMLLDRPIDEAGREWAPDTQRRKEEAMPDAGEEGVREQSVFIFRTAGEWLALPTSALRQVDIPRSIHPIPHRRNGIVLGLMNVQGTLTVAVSLADMLDLDRSDAGRQTSRMQHPRTLVVEHLGEVAALPVDEVEGVVRLKAEAWLPVPATLTQSAAAHALGLVEWRDTTIGLLDPGKLFESLARSLR